MGMRIVPLTSTSQRALEKYISEWLTSQMEAGPELYPGQLTAGTPELYTSAYDDYERALAGDLGTLTDATIRQLISGEPAYTFEPEDVTERWRETYAGPVMETWKDVVLPGIKEGFNIPGVAYSRARGRGVGRASGEFYGQYVAPTLFTALQTGEEMGFRSAELAAGRQMPALELPFQQFVQTAGVAETLQAQIQKPLTALYQDWLRSRGELTQYAQIGASYATDPTMSAFYKAKYKGGYAPTTLDYAMMGIAAYGAMAEEGE